MIPGQNFANFVNTGQLAQQGATDTNTLLTNIINQSLARQQAEQESKRADMLELAKLQDARYANFLNTKNQSEQFDRDSKFKNRSLNASLSEGAAGRDVQLYGIDTDTANKNQYQDFLSSQNTQDRDLKTKELITSLLLSNRKLGEDTRQFDTGQSTIRRGQDLDYSSRLLTNQNREDKGLEKLGDAIVNTDVSPVSISAIPDPEKRKFASEIFFAKHLQTLRDDLTEKMESGSGLSVNEVNSLLEDYLGDKVTRDFPEEIKPLINTLREKFLLQLKEPTKITNDKNINRLYPTDPRNIPEMLRSVGAAVLPDRRTFDNPDLLNYIESLRTSLLPSNR